MKLFSSAGCLAVMLLSMSASAMDCYGVLKTKAIKGTLTETSKGVVTLNFVKGDVPQVYSARVCVANLASTKEENSVYLVDKTASNANCDSASTIELKTINSRRIFVDVSYPQVGGDDQWNAIDTMVCAD